MNTKIPNAVVSAYCSWRLGPVANAGRRVRGVAELCLLCAKFGPFQLLMKKDRPPFTAAHAVSPV